MEMRKILTVSLLLLVIATSVMAQSKTFCIAKDGKTAAIVVDEQDWKGVIRAANDLGISAKYLSALCKKHSGKTANEWITEHVLEDIRYYLKQTDYSIKKICDLLGFPNPSFFGKYVKEHFGQTPAQFRQN
jgi:AraC-like DNA-binding protein